MKRNDLIWRSSHICAECHAHVDDDEGGYGQHDYGCSQGPWPDWKRGDPLPDPQ